MNQPHQADTSDPASPVRRWRPLEGAAAGRRGWSLLRDAARRWLDDGGAQLGAAVAFYAVFAMAPLLVVAIAIAGVVFGEDAARGHIVGQIEGLVGSDAAKAIEGLVQSAWRHPHGLVATLLGVGSLLIGATGVFGELRSALNAIGHVKARKSGLGTLVRARLVAFALVLGFGFLSIASLVLSAATAGLGAYLGRRWQNVGEGLAAALALLDVLLSTAVLTLAFAALLRWLPDTPPSWRAARWGALCSALLFAIGKHLIGLYLARAGVASAYGAAGSLVVIMLWVYYSAQILLFGAALGASLDGRGARSPGSAGPPQAPGQSPRGTDRGTPRARGAS